MRRCFADRIQAAQERVQRVEASPSSEKLWAKLFMSLKTGGLLTKSVDRDEELLHDAEEILDVLKEELTKPEFISVFHYLFEKLYNKYVKNVKILVTLISELM